MYKKKIISVFIVYLILNTLYLILPLAVQADYVLPYPSFMPGSSLYKISSVLDKMKRSWYFGNIAQLKYRMAMSDKKLVEAKTLFEYKQYPLAISALDKSTEAAKYLLHLLGKAQATGIDTKLQRETICDEMTVHGKELEILKKNLPPSFLWQEEKKAAVDLPIQTTLEDAMRVRKNITSEVCL